MHLKILWICWQNTLIHCFIVEEYFVKVNHKLFIIINSLWWCNGVELPLDGAKEKYIQSRRAFTACILTVVSQTCLQEWVFSAFPGMMTPSTAAAMLGGWRKGFSQSRGTTLCLTDIILPPSPAPSCCFDPARFLRDTLQHSLNIGTMNLWVVFPTVLHTFAFINTADKNT